MDMDDRKYMVCPQGDLPPILEHKTYICYRERWYVLLTVCLLALSNATIWISYAPLHEATTKFYCVKDGSECDVIYWTSQIFQIVGVVTGIFGMYVTDRYGIRMSTLCGSTFNFLGAIVRVLSSLPIIPIPIRLPLLYTGQTIAAMSQPFFLCLSPKVAEYWFSDHQRALANALSFVANPLGVVVGSMIPMMFVSNTNATENSDDILFLNFMLLVLSAVVIVMSFTISSSKPPTPPSASSECAHSPPFLQGLCHLFKTPVFYIQMITFGMAFALQWSVFITADKMLGLLQYKDKVTSYLMALSAISGCIGSVLAGYFVDRTKKFKEVIKTCYIGMAIAAVSINVFLRHPKANTMDDVTLVLLLVILGFFAIPVFPISLELGVETTFPVAEATSSGILIIAGQLLMFMVTLGMQSLESSKWIYQSEIDSSHTLVNLFAKNYQLSVDFWTLSAIFSAIFACLCLWPRYRRLEFENRNIYVDVANGASQA
uniref:MFS domain-containing protein n=2 Tax=Bursaphelenchus xylophilus TaxID=6326 RepID=A0A1I7RSX2_BURXY